MHENFLELVGNVHYAPPSAGHQKKCQQDTFKTGKPIDDEVLVRR